MSLVDSENLTETYPSVAEAVDPPSFRDSILDHVESAGRGLFEAFGFG